MNEKTVPFEERVNPMRITDNDTGAVYELDFSRDSVRFAESRGFVVDDVLKFPRTKVEELFYYAFRKNHRRVAKNQSDALLEKMGGLTGAHLERLMTLYNQAALSHVISVEEDAEKNSAVTVEL